MSDNDYVLYLLCRTDLPSMGFGKTVAQSGHAVSSFLCVNAINSGHKDEPGWQLIKKWLEQGYGPGTKIALAVDEFQLSGYVHAALNRGFLAGTVSDDEYPYLVDKEIVPLIDPHVHTKPPVDKGDKALCFRKVETCGYIFGSKASLLSEISDLSLLPNTKV